MTRTVLVTLDIDNLLMRTNWLCSASKNHDDLDDEFYNRTQYRTTVDTKRARKAWLGEDPDTIKQHLNAIIENNAKRGLGTRFICMTAKRQRDDLTDVVETELAGFLGRRHKRKVTDDEAKNAMETFQLQRSVASLKHQRAIFHKNGNDSYLSSLATTRHRHLFPGNHSCTTFSANTIPRVSVMGDVISFIPEGKKTKQYINLSTWKYRYKHYVKQSKHLKQPVSYNLFLINNGIVDLTLRNAMIAYKNCRGYRQALRQLSSAECVSKGELINQIAQAYTEAPNDETIVSCHLLDDGATNCEQAESVGVHGHQMPEEAFFHEQGEKRPDGTRYTMTNQPSSQDQQTRVNKFWGKTTQVISEQSQQDLINSEQPQLKQINQALHKIYTEYRAIHISRMKRSYFCSFFQRHAPNPTRAAQAAYLKQAADTQTSYKMKIKALYAVKRAIESEPYTLNCSKLLSYINQTLKAQSKHIENAWRSDDEGREKRKLDQYIQEQTQSQQKTTRSSRQPTLSQRVH